MYGAEKSSLKQRYGKNWVRDQAAEAERHGQEREKGQGAPNSSGFFQGYEISLWSGEVGARGQRQQGPAPQPVRARRGRAGGRQAG